MLHDPALYRPTFRDALTVKSLKVDSRLVIDGALQC